MKKVFFFVGFVMMIGLFQSCNNTLNDKSETESSNQIFVNNFNQNKDFIKSIFSHENGARSVSDEDSAEIDYYINNPDVLYDDLMNEENGSLYIDFFNSLADGTVTSIDEILENTKKLVGEDEYNMMIDNISDINDIDLNKDLYNRAAWGIDKKVHLFAGATVSLVAATAVYAATPMVAVKAKIITAAAVAAASGITAGALKELWDSCGHGTVDFYDFLATSAGAVAATTVSTAVGAITIAITTKPTAAVIICGVFSVICGAETLNYYKIMRG